RCVRKKAVLFVRLAACCRVTVTDDPRSAVPRGAAIPRRRRKSRAKLGVVRDAALTETLDAQDLDWAAGRRRGYLGAGRSATHGTQRHRRELRRDRDRARPVPRRSRWRNG